MSGASLRVRCPAKINLGLRVLGRRADGYHDLDTVFQAIDLWDELELAPHPERSLECDAPSLPVDESNLVVQAMRLVAEGRGGRLRLHKRIPLQAGLGGGSADAAGALLLADRHWGLGLGPDGLLPLARRLGADVAYFLIGGTARGRGRGDELERLPFVGPRSVVLGCPPFGISTAEVFGRLGDRLTLPGIGVSVSRFSAHKWPGQNDFGTLVNDLEAVVFEDRPELENFRDALREAGAGAALLSGSGSTVYGIFSEPTQAADAAAGVRRRFGSWNVIVTRCVPDGIRWMPAEQS